MFEVRESNSALRNFARVYTINGIEGYDARSSLQDTRQNITSVLRNNRRTKVKLNFKCYMEMLKTSEIKPCDFHSNIEVNLDRTDEKELYDTMAERILEKIATFIATESECRFHSIIKLELHTVSSIYMGILGILYIYCPRISVLSKNFCIVPEFPCYSNHLHTSKSHPHPSPSQSFPQ